MSVNKSCDVISHQLFLHNEADKTTMILQRRVGGWRGWRMCSGGRGDEGGRGLNDEREKRSVSERVSCEVEAEMWHLKVVDEMYVFLFFYRGGEGLIQI